MDFVGAIKAGFKNYVNFRGTATRPEYWYWILFTVLVGIVLGAVDPSGNVNTAGSLALLLPSLGVAVRRLRDAGFSWTWLLFPAVGIITFFVGVFQFLRELTRLGVSTEILMNPDLATEEFITSLLTNDSILNLLFVIFFSGLYTALAWLVVQVIMPIRKTKTFEQGNKRVAPIGPESPLA